MVVFSVCQEKGNTHTDRKGHAGNRTAGMSINTRSRGGRDEDDSLASTKITAQRTPHESHTHEFIITDTRPKQCQG